MSVKNILGSNNKILSEYLPGGELPGVQAIVAGPGISITGPTATPTISNTGVVNLLPGNGITVTNVGQDYTVENDGVISVKAGKNITITGTAQNPIINSVVDPPPPLPYQPVYYLLVSAGIRADNGQPAAVLSANQFGTIASFDFTKIKLAGVPFSNCNAIRMTVVGILNNPNPPPYNPPNTYSIFQYRFSGGDQVANSHTQWWLISADTATPSVDQVIAYFGDDGPVVQQDYPYGPAPTQLLNAFGNTNSPGPNPTFPNDYNASPYQPYGVRSVVVYPKATPQLWLATYFKNDAGAYGLVGFNDPACFIQFYLEPLY